MHAHGGSRLGWQRFTSLLLLLIVGQVAIVATAASRDVAQASVPTAHATKGPGHRHPSPIHAPAPAVERSTSTADPRACSQPRQGLSVAAAMQSARDPLATCTSGKADRPRRGQQTPRHPASAAPKAHIDATGDLHGTVTDGAGGSVQGTIALQQPGTSTVVAQGTTTIGGDYDISVATGTYDVVITPSSTSYVPRTISSTPVSTSTTLDIVIVHTGSSTVSGRLVDDLGQPVSSVTMALSGTSVPTVSVTTGSTGTFTFTLPNSYYQLHLSTQNCSAPTGDVPAPPPTAATGTSTPPPEHSPSPATATSATLPCPAPPTSP